MVKGDSGGDGGVQAINMTCLRYFCNYIRFIQNKLSNSFVFATDNEQEGFGVEAGHIFQMDRAIHIEGHDAVSGGFGAFDIAGAVGRVNNLQVFRGTGTGFDDGGVDAGGATEGEEDGMKAEEIGRAENGTGVAGIFDIVQQEEAGHFKNTVIQVCKRKRGGAQGDALMLFGLGVLKQFLFMSDACGNLLLMGQPLHFIEAIRGRMAIQEQFQALATSGADGFCDGMQSIKVFVFRRIVFHDGGR